MVLRQIEKLLEERKHLLLSIKSLFLSSYSLFFSSFFIFFLLLLLFFFLLSFLFSLLLSLFRSLSMKLFQSETKMSFVIDQVLIRRLFNIRDYLLTCREWHSLYQTLIPAVTVCHSDSCDLCNPLAWCRNIKLIANRHAKYILSL